VASHATPSHLLLQTDLRLASPQQLHQPYQQLLRGYNEPSRRFQSIDEIREYIRINKTHSNKKEPWYYIDKFHGILAKTFPKVSSGLFYTEDKQKISALLKNLSSQDFDGHLWWHTGIGNLPTEFKQFTNEIWLMGKDRIYYEIIVRSVWIYNYISSYNDWILINTEAMPSFDTYDDRYSREEVGVVDGKYYITRMEYDNGYAEIDGEVIDLSKHDVEIRVRETKLKSYFIATDYHCILQLENDKTVYVFIELIESGRIPSKDEFEEFSEAIRQHAHREVKFML
jgi:serine/threonine-protein kinase